MLLLFCSKPGAVRPRWALRGVCQPSQTCPRSRANIRCSITVNDASLFNSGGTLKLLGHTITIPDNLLVQFPAAWVTWRDAVAGKANLIGYELAVSGNWINNVPIAGRVEISQLLLGGGSGLVESVNTDGTMKIANGPTLRINTPNGVFATAYTGNPFFTADEENPSIVAFSGFPMCIPRSASDPACPAANRPANGARV